MSGTIAALRSCPASSAGRCGRAKSASGLLCTAHCNSPRCQSRQCFSRQLRIELLGTTSHASHARMHSENAGQGVTQTSSMRPRTWGWMDWFLQVPVIKVVTSNANYCDLSNHTYPMSKLRIEGIAWQRLSNNIISMLFFFAGLRVFFFLLSLFDEDFDDGALFSFSFFCNLSINILYHS